MRFLGNEVKDGMQTTCENLSDWPLNSIPKVFQLFKSSTVEIDSKNLISSCSRHDLFDVINKRLIETEIRIEDLFNEAEKLSRRCRNRDHYSNYVGVTGPAKVGKTDFASHLFKNFIDTYDYVFYINIKDILADKEDIDLLSFLISSVIHT